MSDFDIAVEKIWDHDNEVELENEQDAVHGPESSAKYPRYKIHFLVEAIALLREAVNLHTVQNIGLANESLKLTADSASYSTNSVILVADPTSFSTNSVNLVADTLPKVVVPTTYPTD